MKSLVQPLGPLGQEKNIRDAGCRTKACTLFSSQFPMKHLNDFYRVAIARLTVWINGRVLLTVT